jgi:alkyldihydroxyacetonephosphate synthase
MTERTRSFWGWGWADEIPSGEELAELAKQVGMFFGAEPRPRPPADVDRIALAAPAVTPRGDIESFCTTDTRERIAHTYGKSYPDQVRAFRGDFTNAPDFVALPRSDAQIEALIAFAAREKIAVVPYGGGTSVVGGVEAREGGAPPPGTRGVVACDLRNFDRVLDVDLVSRAARVQAGATGPRIEAQLAAHGLTLRHYPQSFEFSTLGGWIATRAGGHFATLYTHIDDLVESVRMITPSGAWESRRLPASGAGPSPDRLALGSEGILGVVTEAWMRVQPRPRWRASASVHFARFDDAVAAVRAIAQSGLYPASCRLLDEREAMINRVSTDGSSVVVLGFESADHPLEPWMERALSMCEDLGGKIPKEPEYRGEGSKARGEDAAGAWRKSFLRGPYLQSALVSLGVIADTFETACTWSAFDVLRERVSSAVERAMKEACGGGILSCRFTHVYPDGPAPYFTFLAPGRDGAELEQWRAIKTAASDALDACGATITHHHAVGRVHRRWYDRQRPEPFAAALRGAKRAVDPAGIMNPGVLVDPETN